LTQLETNTFILSQFFGMRLFFLKIPKPLKQYTFFKKDDPFRSPLRAGSGGVSW